jgi:integrase/recombinase XerC
MATKKKPLRFRVDDLMNMYLHDCETRNLSAYSLRNYRTALDELLNYLRAIDHSMFIVDVTSTHIKDFLFEKLQSGDWKANTVSERQTECQIFFNWCVKEEFIEKSPMHNIRAIKTDEVMRRVLTDDELRAILKTCKDRQNFYDVRDIAIFRLLLDTGLRLAELVSIKVDDLNHREKVIKVVGKGRKERYVVYGSKTAIAIDRYLLLRKEHRHTYNAQLLLSDYGSLTQRGVQTIFNRRARMAGIEHIHPHLFRHTFVDRVKRGGMSQENIMTLAGWTSLRMIQHYAASERVDRAISDYTQSRRSPSDAI